MGGIMNYRIVVTIPDYLKDKVDRIHKKTTLSKKQIINDALIQLNEGNYEKEKE